MDTFCDRTPTTAAGRMAQILQPCGRTLSRFANVTNPVWVRCHCPNDTSADRDRKNTRRMTGQSAPDIETNGCGIPLSLLRSPVRQQDSDRRDLWHLRITAYQLCGAPSRPGSGQKKRRQPGLLGASSKIGLPMSLQVAKPLRGGYREETRARGLGCHAQTRLSVPCEPRNAVRQPRPKDARRRASIKRHRPRGGRPGRKRRRGGSGRGRR
jgi:hypothetical protein